MEIVTIVTALCFMVSMLAVVFDLPGDEFNTVAIAVSGIVLIVCMAYWGSVGVH